MTKEDLATWGELCGWALARAHARSGDPAAIAGYLGTDPEFDEAIGRFAAAYADQAERDHAAPRGRRQSGTGAGRIRGLIGGASNSSALRGHRHPPGLDGGEVRRVVPGVHVGVGLREVGDGAVEPVARPEVGRDGHRVAAA